jgi:hypothetical protein
MLLVARNSYTKDQVPDAEQDGDEIEDENGNPEVNQPDSSTEGSQVTNSTNSNEELVSEEETVSPDYSSINLLK